MADEWNLNKPVDSTLISDLPSEHRARKTDVAAVLQKEHATLGDGNSGGEHKQGSAVMWHLATASIPALQPDGTALTSSDNGRLWHDTTTDIIYVLDDYSDPTVDGGWVAIGHYLGDIAINTDKFTVARATGNTVVAGTLDVTGNIDPTTYETTNGGFLDEDAMGSDSAASVASQQSIKAYIDAQTPNANSLCKAWALVSSTGVLVAGYNIASSTRTALGKYTVTWDTNFSSAISYITLVTVQRGTGDTKAYGNVITHTAGDVTVEIAGTDNALRDKQFSIAAFGAQ